MVGVADRLHDTDRRAPVGRAADPVAADVAGDQRPTLAGGDVDGDEMGGQIVIAVTGGPAGQDGGTVRRDVERRLVEVGARPVEYEVEVGSRPLVEWVGAIGRWGGEAVQAAVAGTEVVVPEADGIGLEQLGGDTGG